RRHQLCDALGQSTCPCPISHGGTSLLVFRPQPSTPGGQQFRLRSARHESFTAVQHTGDTIDIRSDHRYRDHRASMQLLVSRLRDRDLEPFAQLGDQRPHNRPLLLQRTHVTKQQIELECANIHRHHPECHVRRVGRGCGRNPPHPRSHLHSRFLAVFVRLDDIVEFDVVERTERQTALVPVPDLDNILLEPTKRTDLKIVRHDDVVPQQPCPRIPPDLTGTDDAARDRARLRGFEHVADLGPTEPDLFVLRLEHALQSLLDLLDRLVDHRVVAHIDTLAGRTLGGLALCPHVEPEHDRVGSRRQLDAALRHTTDTAVHDTEFDLVRAHIDLVQRGFQCLDGTRVVALHDQVQRRGLLHRGVHTLLADPFPLHRVLGVTEPGLPPLGDLPATRSSSTTRKVSPAPGTEVNPITCTGCDGSAWVTSSLYSSTIRRTRP